MLSKHVVGPGAWGLGVWLAVTRARWASDTQQEFSIGASSLSGWDPRPFQIPHPTPPPSSFYSLSLLPGGYTPQGPEPEDLSEPKIQNSWGGKEKRCFKKKSTDNESEVQRER